MTMKPAGHRPGSIWTAATDATLRRMWLSDEYSAEEISRTIGASSRNAVIGRAHRIGLPGKAGGKRTAQGKRTSLGMHPREKIARIMNGAKGKPFVFTKKAPTPPPLPVLQLPPADEYDRARVSFVELEEKHCRFVTLAEPAGPYVKQFCGLTAVPGLAYCAVHAARCYSPPAPRQQQSMVRLVELADA